MASRHGDPVGARLRQFYAALIDERRLGARRSFSRVFLAFQKVCQGPLPALPARCRASRGRSAHLLESGRSVLRAGTALHAAPEPTFQRKQLRLGPTPIKELMIPLPAPLFWPMPSV